MDEDGLITMRLTVTFRAYANSFDAQDHSNICARVRREVSGNCAVHSDSVEVKLEPQSD